jgi:hypothetical protein
MENKLKGGYNKDDDEFDNIAACKNNIEDFVSIVYVKGSPRMTEGYYFRMFHDEIECKRSWTLGLNNGNKNKSYGNFMGPITFKNENETEEKLLIFNNLVSNNLSYKKIKDAAYDMYDFYKNKDLTKRKFPITYTQYKKESAMYDFYKNKDLTKRKFPITYTQYKKESAMYDKNLEHATGFKTCKLDPNRHGYCATNNSAAAAAGGRRKKSVRKSSRSVRKSRKQRKSTRRVRS